MSISPLLPSTTNSSKWSSTAICQKLMYVCYYYARCFGMVAFGIKGCKESTIKNDNKLQESSNISRRNNETHTQPYSIPNSQLSQRSRLVPQAYVTKPMLWFYILVRFMFCSHLMYAVFCLWQPENSVFAFLIYSVAITMTVCPTLMVIVEIWHRRRIIRAINDLFRLLQAIEELHCSYEIFHWTHVAFVTLKIVTFMCEIIISLQSVSQSEMWYEILQGLLQNILLIEIWLNLHVATLLYVCVEAMYGSLNHYMKQSFILRLKAIPNFASSASLTQFNELETDFAKFIDLFKKVHHVGLELHYLWQISVVCALVYIYIGTIIFICFMIWQYFESGVIYIRFIPYVLKLVFDIMLLSLTAHRAIKSSKLIGCMGVENAVLEQNEEWHRQMEHFLYHINLYDFKLNYLGLFDITNATTLTFISGILTSISIFIPFFIKSVWIQKFLEKKN